MRHTCLATVPPRIGSALTAVALVISLEACASAAIPGTPQPEPAPAQPVLPIPAAEPARAPALPSVPHVAGPLAIRVQYPSANQLIQARDSNFILGSIGNGDASLFINGVEARVYPNGAFMGWLPVPSAAAPRYELVARSGGDSAKLTLPVRVNPPAPDLPLTGVLVVDTGSLSPRAPMLLRADERVRVSVRAPANANVGVIGSAGVRALVGEGNNFATDILAAMLRGTSTLVVSRGADSVRLALPVIETLSADSARAIRLNGPMSDSDTFVPLRPVPNGTYKWLLFPGTVLEQTGRVGDEVRVKLADGVDAWVDAASMQNLPAGTALPRRTGGSLSLYPAAEWVDVSIPMSARPAFLVEEYDRRISIILYGATISADLIRYLQNDSLVRVVHWVPEGTDRVRIDVDLSTHPFGFLTMWDDKRGFVLRVRRPPVTVAAQPLRGLTITVDPGHPPAGATGPTQLYEGDAVLEIAMRLKPMLEARGATVVMTRTTKDPVDLLLRSVIARRTNSHALVSLHLNAFGDGTNPFTQNGTSTLFFNAQTEPMARAIQRGLIREMGLRDLGIHYQNISIGRTQWMPALITEGAFVIMPDQEAALRMPEFQNRYARGVLAGLVEYFRSLAK